MNITETLNSVVTSAGTAITNTLGSIALACIILLVGLVIGKITQKLLLRGLSELRISKILKEISGINIKLEELLSHAVEYFIYFIALVMALRQLGIATEILNMISIVVIILIGLFILLGVKDFIPNIISGIVLHQKNTLKEGDIIEFHGVKGKIKEMTLLETKLETKTKDTIIIPNVNLTRNEITKRRTLK